MLLSDQGMHSAIINELDRPRKESAVKNCNKNGIGRMPEFRTLNLKITFTDSDHVKEMKVQVSLPVLPLVLHLHRLIR